MLTSWRLLGNLAMAIVICVPYAVAAEISGWNRNDRFSCREDAVCQVARMAPTAECSASRKNDFTAMVPTTKGVR